MSKELYNSYFGAVNQARSILDRADKANRPLTADETAQYDRIDAEIDRLGAEMDRAAKKTRHAAPPARPVLSRGGDGASLEIVYEGYDVPAMLRGRPERKTVIRPNTAEASRASDRYRQSFLGYLTRGDRQSLGLQVSKDNRGGYLAPPQFVADLIKFLDNDVFMRQLANVLPPMPTAVNIGVPSWDADPGDADWTAEVPAADLAEDDTATLGRRDFMPQLLTKVLKVSNKLLRTSVIDAESLLIQRLGYKFSVTEEQAYLTGSGAGRPLGVFVASNDGISTGRDVTCASATTFTADELINCLFSLKAGYQKNATWVVHRDFLKIARKLKDGNGQYLWQPGISAGVPATILDRPVVMSEYAPNTFTTGQYVAVLGDFKTGYWIADALDMEVQRLVELGALRNQTILIGRKETDGAPVQEEAFARLKLA